MLRRWRNVAILAGDPYDAWRETCSALHLYAQIVGKYRLARTPWLNHSWHATLYVNAARAHDFAVPDGPAASRSCFDLLDHAVIGAASDGRTGWFDLGPMSVADFHARFLDLLGELGATPEFHGRPERGAGRVPFARGSRRAAL